MLFKSTLSAFRWELYSWYFGILTQVSYKCIIVKLLQCSWPLTWPLLSDVISSSADHKPLPLQSLCSVSFRPSLWTSHFSVKGHTHLQHCCLKGCWYLILSSCIYPHSPSSLCLEASHAAVRPTARENFWWPLNKTSQRPEKVPLRNLDLQSSCWSSALGGLLFSSWEISWLKPPPWLLRVRGDKSGTNCAVAKGEREHLLCFPLLFYSVRLRCSPPVHWLVPTSWSRCLLLSEHQAADGGGE